MYDPETLAAARERAKKTKKSIKYYPIKIECDCTQCFGHQLQRPRATVDTHRRNHGRHPEAQLHAGPSHASPAQHAARSPSPIPLSDDDLLDGNLGLFAPDDNLPNPPSPAEHPLLDEEREAPIHISQSWSRSISISRSLGARSLGSGSLWSGSLRSGFLDAGGSSPQSPVRLHQPLSRSWSSSSARSRPISPRVRPPQPRAPSHAPSDSDEEVPVLVPGDPVHDAQIFGEILAQNQAVAQPPPLRLRGGDGDEEMDGREDGEDREDNEGSEPNDDEQALLPPAGPEIRVQPADEAGPEDPDDQGHGIQAFDEHPILRNIYLRTWVLYAFGSATHDTIYSILHSHKLTLLATAQIANYPPELVAQIENMPLTLRSLERRIGMGFSKSITVYPVCPIELCGKRYTFEELAALPDSQCTRHADDPRCPGILYTESTLADGTQKRTPTKSFPYNSIIHALGRLLSRIGIPDFMQHWQGPGDEPVNADIPQPSAPEEWFNNMGLNDRFGNITEAWLWRSQATGLRRVYNEEVYGDEATGDEPFSLTRMPLGLSLGMNLDGFQPFRGKFTSGGSYSVNGVYIVVNNLPFYLQTLVENMVLAIVIPGPKEPKGYALDQMLEPLVDDLITLANGVELPVYNRETGQIEQKLVYAQLSALFLDWQARIKCTGHVGLTAEHNHCLYCKIQQCLLSVEEGFRSDLYELRTAEEHLQHKHAWLRAPADQREEVRLLNGTKFVELDRILGFHSFDNCPIDVMHLFDHGITPAIVRDIIFKPGMLRKRFHRQPDHETPEGRFDSFVERTYFPSHCSRLPTKISKMKAGMKAEQWRTLLVILVVALFEAWRIGDAIPEGDTPRGGRNTRHFKAQQSNANLLLGRRCHVHDLNEGALEDEPEIEDFAYKRIFRHQITRQGASEISALLELVGVTFAHMNVHMVPSFHLATHLAGHLLKYGNPFNSYGYIYNRRPVLIKHIYESCVEVGGEEHKSLGVMVQRFVEPANEPIFPWNHWANDLGIHAWEFDRLGPVKVVPADAFTGVFALSDIELEVGHYWITFAMINTEPEDLVPDYD